MSSEVGHGNRAGNAIKAQIRIIRMGEVVHRTGLCEREIYTRISESRFPSPVAIGPRARGFVEHEVDGWIESLVAAGRADAK